MSTPELRYHPVGADMPAHLMEYRPSRLLVVGGALPRGYENAGQIRLASTDGIELPTGLYVFSDLDGAACMCVVSGAPGAGAASADWNAPEDHFLVRAHGWFAAWWETADPVPEPLFELGSTVMTRAHGEEGTVRERRYQDGTWWYDIRVGSRTRTEREAALAPPELDDDPYAWITRAPDRADLFAATLTRARLSRQLTDTLYSFRATRTIFRPYQFRPVIRLLDTNTLRLLIADEVGLGKTIEAGLVWTELDARNQANLVLVVCSSMLVSKWKGEMRERFSYELEELDASRLDDFLERVETDRLPRRAHWVCSLERLRTWHGLERLSELSPRFDLVIVDEAQAFRNSGTRSNALGALLSDWADALIFLSATPLNLGNDDLYNILELLVPGEFDNKFLLEQRLEPNKYLTRVSASLFDPDVSNETRTVWLRSIEKLTFAPAVVRRPEYQEALRLLSGPPLGHAQIADLKRLLAELHTLSAVITRTRKVEVHDRKAIREAVPIAVEWTDAEARLYQAIYDWQTERARELGHPPGFAMQMPLRLAGSCLPAARDRVLAAEADAWATDDMEPNDVESDESDQTGPLLDDPPSDVLAAARALGDVDTKFDMFVRHLEPIITEGRRVIVFTFSRKALGYLVRRLRERGISVDTLHGGVKAADRQQIMQRFRADQFKVLVASRVASEGLDFEFASAVVNYDLPWNPMEVEQRIGRIDRFGQVEEKLLILNFHTPGTIETDILERVHQRIGVFQDSIGELEPIVRSQLSDLRRVVLDFELTPEQRRRRVDEIATAMEQERRNLEDVVEASSVLASADQAEIDGLERDLVSSGRYIGQPELVLLLRDWVAQAPGATFEIDRAGQWARLRGNDYLERQLRGVEAAGERSRSELEELARHLRNESEITLCLDPDLAREKGAALLNATHPLVRAALRVPGYSQTRFASVSYHTPGPPPGRYFVLLAVATWTGTRAGSELWTEAVTLGGEPAASDVGAGLLAALAEGGIESGPPLDGADLAWPLERAIHRLLARQREETERRTAENDALVETRRVSLRETHDRKVGQIEKRIRTLLASGKPETVRLHKAQLANQERLLDEALARLDEMRNGALEVERVAACVVEVRGR